jgi:hypothetical protein
MKFFLLALAGAVLLNACSSDSSASLDKDVVMHNDFESVLGWTPDASTISKEQAHSGSCSLKADATHAYSLTYYSLLGQLSPTRIRGVRVEGWAYTPNLANSANVQLSIGLNEAPGGKMLASEKIPFSELKDANKWVKVSKDFIFPLAANYSSQLVIYMWNGGSNGSSSGPAYLDDIQLTAIR